MEKANKTVELSSKQVALAVNNVATSGFAMYNAIDRVVDMQVSVDRANLTVKTSLNAVEDAQTRYNKVVEKYGPVSAEAQASQKDLQLAQERYQVSCERADMIQGNLNEAMVQSALTVIPSLITMITSVSTLTAGWTAVTHGVSAAMSFLSANPIILVIAGVAALIAGIIYAYNNCEPFRDLINTIGAYLQGAFLAAWNAVSGAVSWFNTNVIQPVSSALSWFWNNVLAPLGAFLVDTLLAQWNALSAGWSWAYEHLIKPVFDALTWAYNNILKPVADFLGGIASAAKSAANAVLGVGSSSGIPGMPISYPLPRGQEGGIITRPTVMLAGESGPEALIPLGKLGSNMMNIAVNAGTPIYYHLEFHAPLVTVIGGGGGSKQTLKMVTGMIQESLKRVVIEASSISAPSTEKQIRISSDVSNVGISAVQMAATTMLPRKLSGKEFGEERYY
jgi:hypothetical protein